MDDLIRKIELILIETGQHDTKKFRLGEIIKYAPYEVAEILRNHIGELCDVLNYVEYPHAEKHRQLSE